MASDSSTAKAIESNPFFETVMHNHGSTGLAADQLLCGESGPQGAIPQKD